MSAWKSELCEHWIGRDVENGVLAMADEKLQSVLYSVARIRVNPRQAETMVWPRPQIMAYMGDMGRLEARCTKAMTALLMMPLEAGERNPMTRMRIEKNRPNLCFRSVKKATTAAQV